jgi:predicted AAA+ superfamily ATPase
MAKTRREVDFVVPVRTGPPMLVQSCEFLADPRTRKRELSALSDAMRQLGCKTGTVVTRGEDERIETLLNDWAPRLEGKHRLTATRAHRQPLPAPRSRRK